MYGRKEYRDGMGKLQCSTMTINGLSMGREGGMAAGEGGPTFESH